MSFPFTNTDSETYGDSPELHGASNAAAAVVGGVTDLFYTESIDVFSFNLFGPLTSVANIGDSASLRPAGAAGVSTPIMGLTSYLTVGGTESGVSMFSANTAGALTSNDNINTSVSRGMADTTEIHTATVDGTPYSAARSADNGAGALGLGATGQMWFMTEGGDAETRLMHINNDGTGLVTAVDNGGAGVGDDKFVSSFTADLGLDTAAGFYFAVLNGGPTGDHAYLVRGVIGSSAAPVTAIDFPDDIIVNTIQVDAVNNRIYACFMDGQDADPAGIRIYDYDPLTGTLTDQGFLVTATTDSRGQEGGYGILDPRDFALDSSIGRLFYTETLTGTVNATGLFRLDLSNPDATTQLVNQSQFPDNGSNGYIIDVEVDQTTDLVYFSTESQHPSPAVDYVASQNAIWYISENASSGTAVKLALVGLPGGNVFYPGDMTFDQGSRQLYVESEETDGVGTDDVIYVFQLDSAGTTATLVHTINPGLSTVGANIQGMTFSQIAALNSLTGTATVVVEQQAAATTLLTGTPSITDFDGGHLSSATVQITGGTFSSNETSNSDDHLGYGAGKQISGTISGTSITVSWNAATETLTLTGYDTIAHYQSVLAAITYWTTGDNATNYGLNTNRTITWTINDGTPTISGVTVNSDTTTLTLSGVNDAPVNGTVTSATGNENSSFSVSGLQISDPDANSAVTQMTVNLSVTKGVLTLLTNVSTGLTSGDITGNGTASVTLTGTLNEINATLAAVNGMAFLGNTNVSGTDTLTVVTNDGGATGTGGAQSDTDGYTITIIGVNDAPTVAGDGTESLASTNEDVANTALTNTVSALFSGQYSDPDTDAFAGVAVIANGSAAGTGQWQYYNGSIWTNIGAASTAAAVTIAASAPIRFLPANDFNGPGPTLTVKLIDASGGALTNGAIVNVTTSGGVTPYSISTVELSHAVTAINDATTGGVSITGTTAENQMLAADTSTLADADGLGTLHYQWQRDSGSGFVNVGTDQATYTLNDVDVGTLIRVTASYTDGQGTSEAVTSTATSAISAVNDPHSGGASITGMATEDQVLTAASTLADDDGIGTLHYQWQRDFGSGFVDVGTDQSSYTLGDSDVDGVLRVTVSYTDGQGFAESATSASTSAIANVDDIAVANNDAFGTTEAAVIGAGSNVFNDNGSGADTDPDSVLSVIEVNGVAASVGSAILLASGALLTLNVDGTFSYDPNGAFDDVPGASSGASNLTRNDSFTYTLDGGDIATVTVTVSGIDSDGDVLRGINGTNDILTGGIGSDKYYVGDVGDTIVEASGQGTADRVFAEVSFTLAADDDIEIMSTSSSTGKSAIDLRGNILSQTIYGNDGKNVLHDGGPSGGATPDRLVGSGGNDTYIVYNANDIIVEHTNEGSDRISAGVSFTLANGLEIEFLNTTSLNGTAAINLIGNRLSQTIRGNAGNNELKDGGAGDADTLIGGNGDDTYLIYNSDDTITELAGQGYDRVSSAVDVVLANNVSIEYLNTTSLLSTHAIDLTGNNLEQLVRGNAGKNTIDGGDGSDLLFGMGGQDSFRFSTTLSDDNVDRIADFNVANDTIELDHTIFAGLSLGALTASAFKDTAVADKDVNDRIIYNSDTGALLYDADGSGTAFDAARFATVIGDPTLTVADFFVV